MVAKQHASAPLHVPLLSCLSLHPPPPHMLACLQGSSLAVVVWKPENSPQASSVRLQGPQQCGLWSHFPCSSADQAVRPAGKTQLGLSVPPAELRVPSLLLSFLPPFFFSSFLPSANTTEPLPCVGSPWEALSLSAAPVCSLVSRGSVAPLLAP